jgi:GNAT superfamily N-acetyltransferase
MSDNVHIVAATETDTPTILHMIRGLAEYEKMSDRVIATEAALREQLFGPRPAAEVCLVYVGNEAIGFAVFFWSFSTFACRPGLYLEDLFIQPKWRGRGFGRQLLAHVAKIAAVHGCDRMNWAVLPWNQPAIDFYRRLGAEKVTEWEGFKIAGEAFERLARDAGNQA